MEHPRALTIQFNTIAFHRILCQNAKYLLEKVDICVLHMFVPRIPEMGKQRGELPQGLSLGASLVHGLGALKTTASSRSYSTKFPTKIIQFTLLEGELIFFFTLVLHKSLGSPKIPVLVLYFIDMVFCSTDVFD